MKQLTEIKQNAAYYIAWRRLDGMFDHEIYEEMNPENCSYYLKSFDFIKAVKWDRYSLLN